jgi:hypothetical protein
MIVQKGYKQRQKAIQRLQEHGSTAKEAKEKAHSYYHFIYQLIYQFITMSHSGQDLSSIDWIFKAQLYRFKIRYTMTADGYIQWVGDTVLY